MDRSLLEFARTDLFEKVVKRVRAFVEEHRPRFVYAFLSGGKDSTLATLAALRATRNVVVVYTEIVGNTHHLNVELVRELAYEHGMNVYWVYARNRARFRYEIENTVQQIVDHSDMPALIHIRAWGATHGDDFVSALRRWGIPRGYTRWCHHEFKGFWWSELPFTRGRERHLVCGVRASESSHLLFRWLDSDGVRRFEARNGVDVALSPIYDFSDAEVVTVLRRLWPRVLDHYDRYGDSLNCVFCPLRSLEKQRMIVEKLRDVPWNDFAEARERWVEEKRPGPELAERARRIVEVLTSRT